jgi:menaquinone-dependent protoporphyrinogen oxidase
MYSNTGLGGEMKILIAYSSKYGTTRDCAKKLSKKIKGSVVAIDLKRSKPDPRVYDAVIIGGPVYMGKMNRPTASYCETYSSHIKDKPLGLFICHMERDTDMDKQISNVFPKALIEKSSVSKGFGGAYNISKMGFLYKMIIKKATGVEKDKKDIFYNEIDAFADKFNSLIAK